MTNNPYAALRQAREDIDAILSGGYTYWRPALYNCRDKIDAALAGEGAAGDIRERVARVLRTACTAPAWISGTENLSAVDVDGPIDFYALADAALSAIPTPAVVRPEDVSDDTVREGFIHLRYNTSGCSITDNSRFDVSFRVADIRHLIAWAMTRRAPVSDVAVEAALNVWHRTDDWTRDHDSDDWAEMRRDMRAALEAAGRV